MLYLIYGDLVIKLNFIYYYIKKYYFYLRKLTYLYINIKRN